MDKLPGKKIKLVMPTPECLKKPHIRLIVEERGESSGFSVGTYLVPIEKIPEFFKQIKSTDVVINSELAYK
jgi:hypothetical protein